MEGYSRYGMSILFDYSHSGLGHRLTLDNNTTLHKNGGNRRL